MKKKRENLFENLFIVILTFYPLRHISWGLDLWDTGYNYSNFQYMGVRHMDPMWLFSTYLSNVAGNLLMKLPGADSLMGMNFYTGLLVSLLAVTGYFFCTRRLKIPGWIAFTGEFMAVSLCWCPTALLYNYLTYVFFLACVILLYRGLTENKNICLVLAGACLGANVLVRFSNLPEAALILAVWVYDVAVWHKERKSGAAGQDISLWRSLGQHTFWCFVGYGSSLLTLFGYIHVRYGFGNYVAGIKRLFAMTDTAVDYKPDSMFMGMINTYMENLYWVVRIGAILAAGVVFFAAADRWFRICGKRERVCWWGSRLLLASAGSLTLVWACRKIFYPSGLFAEFFAVSGFLSRPAVLFSIALPVELAFFVAAGLPLRKKWGLEKAFWWESRAFWTVVCAALLAWLYVKNFCTTDFLRDGPIGYGPMLRPGILFLMLALLIGVVRILDRNSPGQEKLVSAMLILVVLVTSLGSNNRLFPSMNNLFVAAPYVLWQSWRFCRNVTEKRICGVTVSGFPVKGVLAAFLCMCLFQFGGFGAKFVFAEATGVYNLTASVENNEILKNIKMDPEKARWLTELSAYVEEHGLRGREVILYGYVPSLSYYLQMPPAFNSWSDLTSYSRDVMADAIAGTEDRMREDGADAPVVLAGCPLEGLEGNAKWELIREFMEKNGYELTWENDKFVIFETEVQ